MQKIKKIVFQLAKSIKTIVFFDKKMNEAIITQSFLDSALHSKESLIDESNADLVISLTTYNKRINDVYLVIESLGRQTVKAGNIVLWLCEKEFNQASLPILIKNQMSRGLTVHFCEDLKSYKKLIPSLKEYYDRNIITVDDDVIYPWYFVEYFQKDSLLHKDTVLCYRAHQMLKNKKGDLSSYKSWNHKVSCCDARYDIFPTGVGGVYYPAGIFDKTCIDYALASQLAPYGDDIWFKTMTLINGKKSKLVGLYFNYDNDFIDISSSDDIALSKVNLRKGRNDEQLRNICKYFDISKLI
ncbi:hypothetical protein [Vibrio algivorus]|uniref:Glycosyltransferase family 2 protein n=1 Tax=Vibrio algivorus TaxID=1667024 RepID=A0A557NSR1_9VIBR|nr:hypothetical protein [Vibrio algivorus]TVO31470.1 hypothetical protein FOF44_18025 [Vibrio algivorus]